MAKTRLDSLRNSDVTKECDAMFIKEKKELERGYWQNAPCRLECLVRNGTPRGRRLSGRPVYNRVPLNLTTQAVSL